MLAREKVLIVAPGCPTCAAVKEVLQREGKLQNVRIVDAGTPEGLEFVKRLNVRQVPECAIIEDQGNMKVVRVCTQEDWDQLVRHGQ